MPFDVNLIIHIEQTDSEVKRPKIMKSTGETGNLKMEAEASSDVCNKTANQNPPPPEPPKQDYIHVRARRGQATDSHSLAERVSMSLIVLSLQTFFFSFC